MTATSTLWLVLEHGPLEQLGPDLWRVEGSLPKMALRRHMIVARLKGGGLWVHNAIGVDDKTRLALEALGEVKYIVVPNHYHRLDGGAFSARYPDAQVVAPKGARHKIEERVKVHLTYDEFPVLDELRVAYVAGGKDLEGVWRFHSDEGTTLVFNDALFNQPHLAGMEGFVFRLLGSSGPPKVTRVARMALIGKKKAFRAQLEELAAIPDLVRVIPGHIDVIDEDPAGVLQQVAARL